MFGRCRNVEHVSVKGQNVVHFCRALICPWDGSAGDARTAEQMFFRHLKSLEVSNADLLAFIEDNGRQTPFNVLFADWLFERQDLMDDDENPGKSGANGRDSIVPSENVTEDVDNRLERLQIKRCSITCKYVRRLGQVIQNIVWDHDEGIYMRDEESEESEEEDSMNNV